MDSPQPPPPEDKIIVAVCEGVCVARVEGRGSFKISGLLRDFGYKMADGRHGALVLDLASCIGMDSTFMGTIANLSFKYKQSHAPRIHLVNLSDKNNQLACTLGLQHLVSVHQAGREIPEAYRTFQEAACRMQKLTGPKETQKQTAAISLEAHETLARLNDHNREQFQDVIEFLKQDLASKGGDSDSNGL